MSDEPRKIESLDDLFIALNAADAHLVDCDPPDSSPQTQAEVGGAREILRQASEFLGMRKEADEGLDVLIEKATSALDDVELHVKRDYHGNFEVELVGEDRVDNTQADWRAKGPDLKAAAESVLADMQGWLGP